MTAPAAEDFERMLVRKRELTERAASDPEFRSRFSELQRWQAARLADTYADLRENPRYAPAVEFFLSDLYGPHDVTMRDQEIARAWRYLKRSLPEAPMHALSRAIELDVLTAELDHAMAAELPQGPLSAEQYAQAYRKVDRRESRERQIDLVIGAGRDLERAVRHAWVGAVLKAAHAPAHAAGLGVLQDFIERGYQAFKLIGDASAFLAAIRERETALLEALFAGAGDPFACVRNRSSQ